MAVVQAVLDATERRDWEAVYRRYAPDIVLDLTRGALFSLDVPPGRVFHGQDEWRAVIRAFNEAWRVHSYQHDALHDANDRVVHLLTQRVIGRETGIEFTWSYAQVWTVRDGLIVRMDYYDDRERAMRDAGLDPALEAGPQLDTPRS